MRFQSAMQPRLLISPVPESAIGKSDGSCNLRDALEWLVQGI
jgi:hypothetical protein